MVTNNFCTNANAQKWVSKLKNFNLGEIFGEFLPILGQFLDFFWLGGFHIDPHIVTNNFCFHVMAQKWVSRLRITFLGGFWGIFCQFWGNFWDFFGWGGLPYCPPYWDKQILLPWYGPEMAIKASSFYLLPSLFWTLYTGQGKQGQTDIEKIPLFPTHIYPYQA